jgi:hypothetical protein
MKLVVTKVNGTWNLHLSTPTQMAVHILGVDKHLIPYVENIFLLPFNPLGEEEVDITISNITLEEHLQILNILNKEMMEELSYTPEVSW